MQQLPDIVEKLLPDRLIEAKLVPEIGEPFGGNAMFAGSDFNRIAGHKPDRDKGHEHQSNEGRNRQQ